MVANVRVCPGLYGPATTEVVHTGPSEAFVPPRSPAFGDHDKALAHAFPVPSATSRPALVLPSGALAWQRPPVI